MKKIITIATLLLTYSNVFSANSDCAMPTEYVLQFLTESSSLWKGDQNWMSELISNPQAQVTTVFAQIRDNELRKYQGFAAHGLHQGLKLYNFINNSGMGTTAKFKVTRNNDTVTITSNIQHMEFETASTPDAITDLQNNCIKIQSLKPKIQKDSSSTCEYRATAILENNNKLKVILNATCTTAMKFDEFFRAVKKSQSE